MGEPLPLRAAWPLVLSKRVANAVRPITWSAWAAVAVATAVMLLTLSWGVLHGGFAAETAALLDMPWGLVSLVEIYVGMVLFGGWVFWREASHVRACVWILAVMLLGNLVSCVYVLLALRGARNDALVFWLGDNARG